MANVCDNRLVVRGPKKHIVELGKWLRKADEEGAESVVPMPKHLQRIDRERYPGKGPNLKRRIEAYQKRHQEVRDWQHENWGGAADWTDDPIKPQSIDREGDSFVLRYVTGSNWSPPIGLLTHAARKWPSLTISLSYREDGMGFEGSFKVKGDCVIRDEQRDTMNMDDSEED